MSLQRRYDFHHWGLVLNHYFEQRRPSYWSSGPSEQSYKQQDTFLPWKWDTTCYLLGKLVSEFSPKTQFLFCIKKCLMCRVILRARWPPPLNHLQRQSILYYVGAYKMEGLGQRRGLGLGFGLSVILPSVFNLHGLLSFPAIHPQAQFIWVPVQKGTEADSIKFSFNWLSGSQTETDGELITAPVGLHTVCNQGNVLKKTGGKVSPIFHVSVLVGR